MVRKTKKVSKSKGMTVPQLRKAFEHIESYARKHDVSAFRKEWKKTFGKPISEHAAKDYISFLKSSNEQSGGGSATPLAGAPLDYTTRAGADPSTAAQVPPYVSSGFGFANMDSFRLMSGKEDITPRIPADMGSNLVGGSNRVFNSNQLKEPIELKSLESKRKTRKSRKGQVGGAFPSLSTAVSEMMSRPFAMNSPPTTGNIMTMAAKAHTDDIASPRPENNNLSFTQAPTIYSATANNQTRTF
jgi:hypothetical protein